MIWIETAEKICFYDRRFSTFHVINWQSFKLEQNFVHQNIPQRSLWKYPADKHDNLSRLRNISKDIGDGSKWLLLNVYVDQKTSLFPEKISRLR